MRLQQSVIAALAAVTMLAACGDEAPSAAAPAPTRPRTAASASADAGVGAAQYLYSYNPVGKRDPFRGYVVDTGQTGPVIVDGPCNEALCRIDLDSLKVVAVISGDANPLAMLEDSSGIGYVVRRNAKVGRQGGKVTAIQRDCIVVTSYMQGVDGKAQANKVNLCIKPDENMKEPVDLMQGK